MSNPLRDRIARELNCCSAENESNTPDFILAQFLLGCLAAFDKAVNERTAWYDPKIRAGAGMETPVESPPIDLLDELRKQLTVPPGHFWRGERDRYHCRNCGRHYDEHLATDESTTCPTANRESEQ